METTPLRAQILDTIIRKSTLKQRVFDNTFGAFNSLKETLLEMASEMDDVAMLPHALRALTAAYPDLRVTVATQAMFRPFFAGLDVGFLDVDVKGAHHSLAGMWRLAAQARRLGVATVTRRSG